MNTVTWAKILSVPIAVSNDNITKLTKSFTQKIINEKTNTHTGYIVVVANAI